jgi:membrane protein
MIVAHGAGQHPPVFLKRRGTLPADRHRTARVDRSGNRTTRINSDERAQAPNARPDRTGRSSGAGWAFVVARVVRAAFSEDLWGVAGGVAFYAWFAAVFVLVFLVSLYGLIASPDAIGGQIEAMSGLVPEEASRFLAEQMKGVAGASPPHVGARLGGSFLVALWSARAATATLIAALNITFRERETRPFLRLQATTFAVTAAAALFAIVAFAVVVAPAIAAQSGMRNGPQKTALLLGRWLLLAALMSLALAALYRFAPCRATREWRWVSGGAAVATALWLLGSAGLSSYVARLSSTYGTFSLLGAVLMLQTWLYITAFAVLLGAKLNAEAEHQAIRRAPE